MKYGLLIASTENLGDDIQALAAKQFLPKVDVVLDRDFLNFVDSDENIKVIMNGWFTHCPENWPPSPIIDPLFVSFHVSPMVADRLLTNRTIDYLKEYQPIGCRDIYTKKLLELRGIEAYFSGCLTLTLDYGYGHFKTESKQNILIVDLDNTAMKYLPEHILKDVEIVTHNHFTTSIVLLQKIIPMSLRKTVKTLVPPSVINNVLRNIDHSRGRRIPFELRLKKAEEQLQRLASARLVITSRLHATLPALAFGTPVIFVHRNLNDPRFSGLLQYLNYYSTSDFKREANKINFYDPPDNPNREMLEETKRQLIKIVTEFISN